MLRHLAGIVGADLPANIDTDQDRGNAFAADAVVLHKPLKVDAIQTLTQPSPAGCQFDKPSRSRPQPCSCLPFRVTVTAAANASPLMLSKQGVAKISTASSPASVRAR